MRKLILLFLFVFIINLFLVNAGIDCNITVPLTIGNLSNISASVNVSRDTANITVFFEAKSASTRNSSYSFIGNATNTSNLRFVNLTIPNNVILEDASNYIFRATCRLNASCTTCSSLDTSDVGQVSSETTNRLVDRTKPSKPTAVTFTNPLKDTNTITATIDRSLANRCFIRFGSIGVERRAMTLSGSTCTFTVGQNNPPNSDYQAFVEADDMTNSTFSDVQSTTIRAVSSDGGGVLSGASVQFDKPVGGQSILGGKSTNPFAPQSRNKNDNWVIWGVIGFLAYLLFKGKK